MCLPCTYRHVGSQPRILAAVTPERIASHKEPRSHDNRSRHDHVPHQLDHHLERTAEVGGAILIQIWLVP